MSRDLITPVILSGGAGTRLWPLSRAARPKQMLPLIDRLTMLQLTARRTDRADLFGTPIVVANATHADMIEAQFAEIGAAPPRLILEPSGRNTAPAIALAALAVAPESVLLVMPSDHVIGDVEAFQAAVVAATPLARDGWLVTFGITPVRPDTGFGYIRRGERLADGIFVADAFVEKPDAASAQAYLDDGRHDWNAGIFLFRADAYLETLARFAPDIRASVEAAFSQGRRAHGRIAPDGDLFAQCRSQSIDHAVMEKTDRIAVAPVAMQWSDVGSWDALYDLGAAGDDAVVSDGDVVAIDSVRCLLRSSGPTIVTVGVSDLVVIATEDAVLILPRGDTQRVREAVDALTAKDSPLLDR